MRMRKGITHLISKMRPSPTTGAVFFVRRQSDADAILESRSLHENWYFDLTTAVTH